MKKYSLYLFDFDGTLFDTLDSLKEVYRLSLLKYGLIAKEEEYPLYLGQSLPLTFKYKGGKKEDSKAFIEYFHTIVHTSEVVKKTKLYVDTLDIFKYLHTHAINYGIVTGSSSLRVKDVLKYFGIDTSLVKVIVGNDIYRTPKPDPDPINIALKKTGYLSRRNEVVYIGDAKQDEECAKNAKIDYFIVDRHQDNIKPNLKSLLDLFK
ncbi:MAG: HAD family hydrolase [Bacilli bacterium]|nr:HAD family hydrolase [Bacilli bacterium]